MRTGSRSRRLCRDNTRSKWGQAPFIDPKNFDTEVNVENDINAYAPDCYSATGIRVRNAGDEDSGTESSFISVNAGNVNVEVSSSEEDRSNTLGVYARSSGDNRRIEINVNVKAGADAIGIAIGNDQAPAGTNRVQAGSVTAEGENFSTGVSIEAIKPEQDESAEINVTTKDIIAKGENGVGVLVKGSSQKTPGNSASINIVADGTISGEGVSIKIVGDSLDKEQATVVFQNADKVLNTDEMDRFNLLSIKNQFLVLLSVLGFEDEVQDVQTEINREAKALVTSVSDRIAALSDAEKPAVDQLFPQTKVTINSKECNSIGIVLVIDHNGTRDYNRYTFYEADDAWRLYQIEQGKLK